MVQVWAMRRLTHFAAHLAQLAASRRHAVVQYCGMWSTACSDHQYLRLCGLVGKSDDGQTLHTGSAEPVQQVVLFKPSVITHLVISWPQLHP